MMRVLRLIDSLDPRDGGPPAGVLALDAQLRRQGHVVRTLTMSKPGQKQPGSVTDTSYYSAWRFGPRRVSLAMFVEAMRRGRDIDVIVMHGFYLWHNLVA